MCRILPYIFQLLGRVEFCTFLSGPIFQVISYKKWSLLPQTTRSAFSIQHPIDCIRTTFKKREGPNRKYILIFFAIMALTVASFVGEGSVSYNYVRTRYEWDYEEYSQYKSIISACMISGIILIFYKIVL